MGSSQSKKVSVSGIVWNASNSKVTYALTQQIIKHKRLLYQRQFAGNLKNTEIDIQKNGKLHQQYYYQDLKTFVIVKSGQVTNIGLQNVILPAYFSCWIGDQKQVEQLLFQNVVVTTQDEISIKINQNKIFRIMRDFEIQNAKKVLKLDKFFEAPNIQKQLIQTEQRLKKSINALEVQRYNRNMNTFAQGIGQLASTVTAFNP